VRTVIKKAPSTSDTTYFYAPDPGLVKKFYQITPTDQTSLLLDHGRNQSMLVVISNPSPQKPLAQSSGEKLTKELLNAPSDIEQSLDLSSIITAAPDIRGPRNIENIIIENGLSIDDPVNAIKNHSYGVSNLNTLQESINEGLTTSLISPDVVTH